MKDILTLTGTVFFFGIITGALIVGIIWAEGDYLPPCQTEDATGCYWDASEQGNGQGNDFIAP